MTPTIDQLFSAGSNAQPYSIDQVLAGIQGQYTARPQYQPSMTIDDILAGLVQVPQQATPYATGAQRFVSDVAPSAEYFKPAEFDAQKYKMDYESAQDKADRIYGETYASQIAAGKSQAEAQREALKESQRAAQVGSMIGATIGRAYGGPVGAVLGSMLGSAAAPIIEPVTSIVSDIGSSIGDVFGW
jgi:hypothetical protein